MPRLSVLDRYLINEFILPFLFGLGVFLSVGVSAGALFELVRRVAESGLDLSIAIQVLLLRIPQFLAYSFPTATLLACLMAYGRLANDSEIVALRSVGISVYRLVAPVLVLSVLIAGLTFVFNEAIVPEANYQGRVVLREALGSSKPPFRETNILYSEFDPRPEDDSDQEVLLRYFYAEQFDGDRMINVTAIDRSDSEYERIISADTATWNPKRNLWEFYDGTMYIISPDAAYREVIRFKRQALLLPRTPLDLTKRTRDYDEMNIVQSLALLQQLQNGGKASKVRELRIRIQQKFAFPFICLVFGMIGVALGAAPQEMSRARSFGISSIAVFLYYLTAFVASAIGQVGLLTPFLAAWLPNVLGLGLGVFLLQRAAR